MKAQLSGDEEGIFNHPEGVIFGLDIPPIEQRHKSLKGLLVCPLYLGIKEGVLDGDGGLSGEGLKYDLVILRECIPLQLIEYLNYADDLPLEIFHGRAEDRFRPVAGASIDLFVKPGVGIGIRDINRSAGSGDISGDALINAEPYLFNLISLRDQRPQFPSILIQQEHRSSIRP